MDEKWWVTLGRLGIVIVLSGLWDGSCWVSEVELPTCVYSSNMVLDRELIRQDTFNDYVRLAGI